jgi:hypothetical protein
VPFTSFSPWPEVDTEVFDRLGGRDSLRLWIKARDFQACQYTYSTRDKTISISGRIASFVYLEPNGRRRRLRITESEMGKITIVTLDIQPVPPSLEWLVWVLSPKGDMDSHRHRHTYEVSKLGQVDLASKVENLIVLSLSPFSGV